MGVKVTEASVVENKLIWRQGYETVQIESWGVDSLRVRVTRGPAVVDNLPGALLEVRTIAPTFQVSDEKAVIRNGAGPQTARIKAILYSLWL